MDGSSKVMPLQYLALAFIFLQIPAVTVTEEFAHRPINVYSVEQDGNHDGAEDSLQCIFNPPIDPTGSNSNFWKDCRTDQDCTSALTEDDTIYDTDYSVSQSVEGDYNLTINDVTSVSAGTYLCEAKRGPVFSRAKGRMLVIDNHPSCFYTTTDGRDPAAGEDIHLHYWVVYAQAVDFKPVMFWTIDGEVIQPPNDPPVDGDGQHNYSSRYTYTLPKKSDVQMQCHTTFEVQNTDKDLDVATNNPTYEDINKLDAINVKVPAEDDTTVIRNSNGEEVNDNDVFHPDDKLICNDITANPSPDITWTWDNGTVSGTVYDNPFTFKETMIGYEYNISCEASNEVNGLTHTGRATLSSISVDEAIPTTTTFAPTTSISTSSTRETTPSEGNSTGNVEETSGGGGGLSTGAIVGITVGGLAVGLLIAILVYFLCCRNRSSGQESSSNKSKAPKTNSQSMAPDVVRNPNANVGYHPENGQEQPYGNIVNNQNVDPRKNNDEGVVYADLALDNTPRSRNPVQLYEPSTEYAEIKQKGGFQ